MLRRFRNSAAVMVAMTALAAPLAAQTTQPAPETPPATAPATQPAPATALPQALTDLGITDARVSKGRRGQQVQGTLPGGPAFRAMLDSQGTLRMIRAESAPLPAALVERLVPQPVRDHAILKEFAQIQGIGRGDQGVMVFGTDAQGQGIRAGFGNDGTLHRFGRGETDFGPRGIKGKDRGAHDHGMGWRGKDGRDDRGMRQMQRFHRGDDARRAPQAAPAALDDAGVQRLLQDAGYTQPGTVTRDGPRIEVEAVNPEGEPVTVTITARGVIVRELAR